METIHAPHAEMMQNLSAVVDTATFIAPRIMEEVQAFTPSRGAAAEASSAVLAPVAGPLPVLCHHAALTHDTLAAMRDCGLPAATEVSPYRDRDDYLGQVRERMDAGGRAWFTQVVPEGVFPSGLTVVASDILRRLNDKTALNALVPAANVPERRVVEGANEVAASLAELTDGTVVKAVDSATSGGAGVVVVRSARHIAEARRRFAGCTRLVIEQRIEIRRNLNVQYAVLPDGRLRELGSSEQVCSKRGLYFGNRIVPGVAPSCATRALAARIAATGAAQGFRGICGFDIVEDHFGDSFAIDLNFRPNGSTPFLLLTAALGRARNMTWATLAFCSGTGSLGQWLARLRPHFDAGWLLLTAANEAGEGATRERPVSLRLIVMAQERGQMDARLGQLSHAGLHVASHMPGLLERVRRTMKRVARVG